MRRSWKPIRPKCPELGSALACLIRKVVVAYTRRSIVSPNRRTYIDNLNKAYRRLEPDHKGNPGCGSDLTEIPEGHLPVYVGNDLQRFVIGAHFLNHPIFAELLQMSAEEYGYEQKGGLKIPCDVMFFENIVCLLESQQH